MDISGPKDNQSSEMSSNEDETQVKDPTQEDSKEDVENANAKGKRRSKWDKILRNYVCGCGKQYLSHPALYTHIKTKHGGIQPVGTKNCFPLKLNKRGRPKKIQPTQDGRMPNIITKSFLNPYIVSNQLNYKGLLQKGDLKVLKAHSFAGGKSDALLGFPVYYEVCSEDDEELHPLAWYLYHFKKNDLHQVFPDKDPSCDMVISLFLYCLSRYLHEKLYQVMSLLFRNLRECLNEYGYDVVIGFLEKNGKKENIENLKNRKNQKGSFCEKETCQYLPIICEKFIIEYLPDRCPDFEPQLAIDAMHDFCSWLVKKPFTKTLVSVSLP